MLNIGCANTKLSNQIYPKIKKLNPLYKLQRSIYELQKNVAPSRLPHNFANDNQNAKLLQ
jgi:hypothetical protein